MQHKYAIAGGTLALVAGSAFAAGWMLPNPGPSATVNSSKTAGSSPAVTLVQATTPASNVTGMPRRGPSEQHFITRMIPHHESAIAMADLALARSQRPEIKQLAQDIKTSQSQEIAQMRDWYREWYGSSVPEWQPGQGMGMGMGPGRGMGHGRGQGQGWRGGAGQQAAGMGHCAMETDLAALETAPDFDQAFLLEMIPHHQMAIMMANHVLLNIEHPEMRELAQSIIREQQREIDQMTQWYQQWYPQA
jgi:uncharacterized protein (DUF305 family)